ncbi:hypothetical protein SAMN05421770_101509 [Granulicella rosea]|uniref:Uncharacterized protein n=1 Tax=Granulicella rosea TaxID=474952 RepID=A0A239DKQ5_9BACT|nr:hypothetical protein SAMN05421770_101509 [Granulicella rosea]
MRPVRVKWGKLRVKIPAEAILFVVLNTFLLVHLLNY